MWKLRYTIGQSERGSDKEYKFVSLDVDSITQVATTRKLAHEKWEEVMADKHAESLGVRNPKLVWFDPDFPHKKH